MDERQRTVPHDALSEPKVSVIIPAYKAARFIGETIDSVFAQTFSSFEIIVINDGSPDVDELERVLSRYPTRLSYVSQRNQGAGAARNAGLRLARGEFVAFLDSDDVWLPRFLEEQLALITSKGGFDLVYSDAVSFSDPASPGRSTMETNPSFGEVTFESLTCGRCTVITSAVLARRERILAVGLFDQSLPNSQDFDLWLRLLKDGNARSTYQRKALVRRRIYEGSLSFDPVKSLAGELSVLNKVLRRTDLSQTERATVEHTIARRQATVDVIQGKRSLIAGDFVAATHLFAKANETMRSWKLRLVIFWLKVAPRLFLSLYGLRPT
jgi:glycosyltransferase involved in cell wall biosynthesis